MRNRPSQFQVRFFAHVIKRSNYVFPQPAKLFELEKKASDLSNIRRERFYVLFRRLRHVTVA
jgi:hypothetical protein